MRTVEVVRAGLAEGRLPDLRQTEQLLAAVDARLPVDNILSLGTMLLTPPAEPGGSASQAARATEDIIATCARDPRRVEALIAGLGVMLMGYAKAGLLSERCRLVVVLAAEKVVNGKARTAGP